MTLTLSARIESTNPCHAEIGVFQNGGKAGVLRVQAEHAKEILGILNAGPQLLAACRGGCGPTNFNRLDKHTRGSSSGSYGD